MSNMKWNEIVFSTCVFHLFEPQLTNTHISLKDNNIPPEELPPFHFSIPSSLAHSSHDDGRDSSKIQPNFPFLLLVLKWINVKHKHTGKHFEYPWDAARNKQSAKIIWKDYLFNRQKFWRVLLFPRSSFYLPANIKNQLAVEDVWEECQQKVSMEFLMESQRALP